MQVIARNSILAHFFPLTGIKQSVYTCTVGLSQNCNVFDNNSAKAVGREQSSIGNVTRSRNSNSQNK